MSRTNPCDNCPLADQVTQVVVGSGPRKPHLVDLIFVGEAPGKDEDKKGIPFVGAAGTTVFDPALDEIGIPRRKATVLNVLRCRPPNNKIKHPDAVEALSICPDEFLFPEIARLKPKVVVAMGFTAIKMLTGKSRAVKEMRGTPIKCEIDGHEFIVIPTYHPAGCLPGRNPANRQRMVEDFRMGKRLATGERLIDRKYYTLDTKKKAVKFFRGIKKAKRLVLDVEAQNHDPNADRPNVLKDKILGISFSWKEGRAAYLPLRIRPVMSRKLRDFWKKDQDYILELLRELCESSIPKINQNIKYDAEILWFDYGIQIKNIKMDTLIAAHLRDENQKSHALDAQVDLYLPQFRGFKKMIKGEGEGYRDMAAHPLPVISEYASTDTDTTHRIARLHDRYLSRTVPEYKKLRRHDMLLNDALTKMEIRGAEVDVSLLPQLIKDLEAEEEKLTLQMRREFGRTVNPDSKQEIIDAIREEGVDMELLHEEDFNGNVVTDARGRPKYKTDKNHLEVITDTSRVASLVLSLRTVSKLLSTYATPIYRGQVDGRIHGSYMQARTVTWRLASANPNLQNIPGGGGKKSEAQKYWGKKVKGVFIAKKGYVLLYFDFSQMEVRTLAYDSQDDALAYACDSEDVHLSTAVQVFELDYDDTLRKYLDEVEEVVDLRTAAKSVTFLVIYGGSAEAAAKMYHLPIELMKDFQTKYFEKFKKAAQWIELTQETADENKIVFSMFGRPRRIPYAGEKGLVGRAHRQAVNSPIQGAAAHITNMKIYQIMAALEREGYLKPYDRATRSMLGSMPVLTVHDSVIVEVAEEHLHEVAILVNDIALAPPFADFNVKLKIDMEVGYRWGEFEKYKIAA